MLELAHAESIPRTCDDGLACPPQSELRAAIRGESGLHVLFVDGATAADSGDYTITVEVP